MTTIDIILFCYKQEQYIEQALRSIYAQELPKNVSTRIIVADDASPDNTLAIIKRLAPESPFPMIFLPKEPNMGISMNYKRSFAATKAEYVAILEGDDYWQPNHLKQHVTFLQSHSECSMSANLVVTLYEPSNSFSPEKWVYQSESYTRVTLKQQIAEGNHLGNLSACMFRGELVRKLPNDLFDMKIADWMIGIMMAEKGDLGILKDSTSVYRVKASGEWAGKSRWQSHVAMLKDAEIYDKYLKRKYHSYWKEFKRNRWAEFRENWIHYFPQGLKNIGKKILRR